MISLFHIIPGGPRKRPGKKKTGGARGMNPGGPMKRAHKVKKTKQFANPGGPMKRHRAPSPKPATAPG